MVLCFFRKRRNEKWWRITLPTYNLRTWDIGAVQSEGSVLWSKSSVLFDWAVPISHVIDLGLSHFSSLYMEICSTRFFFIIILYVDCCMFLEFISSNGNWKWVLTKRVSTVNCFFFYRRFGVHHACYFAVTTLLACFVVSPKSGDQFFDVG